MKNIPPSSSLSSEQQNNSSASDYYLQWLTKYTNAFENNDYYNRDAVLDEPHFSAMNVQVENETIQYNSKIKGNVLLPTDIFTSEHLSLVEESKISQTCNSVDNCSLGTDFFLLVEGFGFNQNPDWFELFQTHFMVCLEKSSMYARDSNRSGDFSWLVKFLSTELPEISLSLLPVPEERLYVKEEKFENDSLFSKQ